MGFRLPKKNKRTICIEDIKKILPDNHFITYNEEFDHGVKLHLVDMSGMNKTPETILEYLESFIKEAKSIIS